MLVCLPAANIYDRQNRVAGHKHTPAARAELRKLQELAPRLRELGCTRIVCSDLDAQSGEALGRRLNVPVEEWESLRRFNYGKLHGTPRAKADAIRANIVDIPVPVKQGDSQASFRRRIAATQHRLATVQPNTLVMVDAEVLEKLAGAGGAERYHIYEVELSGKPDEAESIRAAAPGRCC